jgi:hypothetical protein
MSDERLVELNELCGMHKLSGVYLCETTYTNCWEETYTVNAIRFILDGVTYEAIEDPDDGYRSYMSELRTTDEKVRYTFPSVDVLCSLSEKYDRNTLCFRDVENGKTILEIGTDHEDGYYPYCVFEWMPEKMACNENAEAKLKGESNA